MVSTGLLKKAIFATFRGMFARKWRRFTPINLIFHIDFSRTPVLSAFFAPLPFRFFHSQRCSFSTSPSSSQLASSPFSYLFFFLPSYLFTFCYLFSFPMGPNATGTLGAVGRAPKTRESRRRRRREGRVWGGAVFLPRK